MKVEGRTMKERRGGVTPWGGAVGGGLGVAGGEGFFVAGAHPFADGGEVGYGDVGVGEGLEVAGGAEFGGEGGEGEAAGSLGGPDFFPPGFVG